MHILTDPIFTGVPPFVKRLTKLPIEPENLPGVDIVVISHAHRDHLDIDSIQKIQKLFPEVTVHLPSGMGEFARDEGLEKCGNTRVVDDYRICGNQNSLSSRKTLEQNGTYRYESISLGKLRIRI